MHKHPPGYTIVEVMIVLAVTGMLAVSAFTSIQGQQQKTEFTQAIRDFDAVIIDVANDVANGYFPSSDAAPECILSGAGKPSFTLVTAGQGGSAECIFIGKALQFSPDGDEAKINVYTVAGRRVIGTTEVSSLADANPTPVADPATSFDITQQLSLKYGMRVKSITPSTGVIAFMTNFNNVNSVTGDVTGNPSTDLKYIDNVVLAATKASGVNALNATANYLDIGPGGIQICLEKDNRTALLTIGANNRKLSTETEIDAGC